MGAEIFKKLAAQFPEKDHEWRISHSGQGNDGVWAFAVPYISARAVMDRLDETCEPHNWSVSYRLVSDPAGNDPGFIATIGIRVAEGGEWVFKEDGSDLTNFEAFKGGISGALKRTAVVWGIGRYLYDIPAVKVETSEQHQRASEGWEKAETRDKKPFWWRLPSKSGSNAQARGGSGSSSDPRGLSISPNGKAGSGAQPQAVMSRDQAGARIFLLAKQLGIKTKELEARIETEFDKPMLRLTDEEMVSYVKTLEQTLGRK